jgi:excisionase family DNA binding protein
MVDSTLIPNKPTFNTKEVAKILSVHVCTIDRWRAEGKITGKKLSNKCVRFSRTEVFRMINGEET